MLIKPFLNTSNVFWKILTKWLLMEGIFLRFDMKFALLMSGQGGIMNAHIMHMDNISKVGTRFWLEQWLIDRARCVLIFCGTSDGLLSMVDTLKQRPVKFGLGGILCEMN